MTLAGVKQGSGIPSRFIIWKNKTGLIKFTWAELQNVIVWVYGASGSVIGKYSWKEKTGYNHTDFSQVDETYAEFRIRMNEDVTRKARAEKCSFEIKFWVIDENWKDGLRPLIGSAQALNFSEAKTKNESPS